MAPPASRKILILCTGNSARSILGEYLLRARGGGRFEVQSAGAKPSGRVNPLAVRVLRERYGIEAGDARSKSWDEFRGEKFHVVITVCGNANEACPAWLGGGARVHWGSPDPAAVEGREAEKLAAFENVAAQIARRVEALVALPEAALADIAAWQAIGELA